METTFISIHDLSLDARLLYSSSSITDILGYTPEEVVGKSCWEYFHPDEIPFARAIHGRGVQLDKAAVLNYCQIKNKQGLWIGCECVFTIVHDVVVACTSIYRRGMKSQKRAAEAPIIRRLFSSSPRDPRYHMLSYISTKFENPQEPQSHEPRAALFLNRFTRTLTIMYATNGLEKVLGISADQLINKSFYYCIQENCLQEAVRCLESAKANDSIAYLRFWFRNPALDDQHGEEDDESMGDANSTDQDDDGGVDINSEIDMDSSDGAAITTGSESASRTSAEPNGQQSNGYHGQRNGYHEQSNPHLDSNSRSTSGNSTDFDGNGVNQIFDRAPAARSSTSSLPLSERRRSSGPRLQGPPRPLVELEAVVSCTSDGLVLILRSAKPAPPVLAQSNVSPHRAAHPYRNGLFASPWAVDPIIPQGVPHNAWLPNYNPPVPTAAAPNFSYPVPQQPTYAAPGPHATDFLQTIRDVAVFAWSLTGINGSLERYSRGTPSGESQPPGGLQVWQPKGQDGNERNGYDEHNGYHGGSGLMNGHVS